MAVRKGRSEVLAEAFFEKVPVAFFQPELVIMNNEKSIHISIIMVCLRLGERWLLGYAIARRCRTPTFRKALVLKRPSDPLWLGATRAASSNNSRNWDTMLSPGIYA